MIKTKFKRATSLVLAALMCVTAFSSLGSTTAFAATGEKTKVYMVDFPRDGGKTSDSRIASISSEGILTAKKPGTVDVVGVSLDKNRYIASLKITVGAELKSVRIPDEIVMYKGTQKDISVSVSPRNAYVGSITYALSNNSVAAVSKIGRIFAKAPGLVKITVTVNGGKK